MQPRKKSIQSINPRRVLENGGADELAALLQSAGYVPQAAPLGDLAESLAARIPLLVEGPRGAGKTKLAEALAESCNLNLYYLACMDGLCLSDILFQWDAAGQNQFVVQSLQSGVSFAEARAQVWSREFLILGEALAAFSENETDDFPNVLVIDEIDKLPERSEDSLLQLLARGYAHVPRLRPEARVGLTDEKRELPIVILTSNDMRSGVSGPLRSRCLYTYINAPSPEEEVVILKSQVPEASDQLLAELVKATAYIRQMPSISEKNKPGLRETVSLLEALVGKKIETLTAAEIESHACYLAKQGKDRRSLLEAKGALAYAARAPHRLHDENIRCGLEMFRRKTAAPGENENQMINKPLTAEGSFSNGIREILQSNKYVALASQK